MPRQRLTVHGRVQGVGFRYFVAMHARAAGITGWVQNRADGAVEAVCEGPADALERLRQQCARGPGGAYVKRVDVSEEPETGEFRSFDIRH